MYYVVFIDGYTEQVAVTECADLEDAVNWAEEVNEFKKHEYKIIEGTLFNT